MKLSYLLGATALASAAALFPQTSFAQSEDATASAQKPQAEGEAILVTGSRIRQPNLESTSPITSISGEEFFETGQISVGDVLNDLPQLRNTYSQQNSTRFLGTRGLNLLDLRGLGSQRTLVLVNGRRHVAGDILVNGVSPDINTIPTDLIQSVDIRTGGRSSVYGSDAIAGVVNFILKQDYDGIQLRGQAGANLDYKDAGNQYLSALIGKNFAEGRGNVALNVEYAHQSAYFGSGRPNLRQNDGFVVTDTDPAGSINGSDGIPDRTFYRDIRSATISTGGQLGFTSPTGACGRDAANAAFTCAFLFQPDGSLIPQTGTRVGIGPNGNFIGGNGYSGREGSLLTLSPDLERLSVNVIGHFDVSPAFVPFVEAKYVRARAFGSQSGPFFSQGTTLGDDPSNNRERPRLDNPYLSAQARSVIEAQVRAGGGNPTNATRFSLRKNWVELGIRDERITRETFRAVGGVRGDFNDDWNYEVSVNYGEHKEKNLITGNINIQRYLLALDTVRDSTGQIVCRSKIDPAARIAYVENAAILAQDVAACVPLNPFGDGSSSQAARSYLTVPSVAQGKITQFVASGFVSGDFSQLFELPGGPIGFSVGAEYRRETNFYDLDDLTQAGYAFYNAIPEFTSPAFEVKEAFGELSIPLLRETPFFHDLTLSGAGRIANYKGRTGTVFAWDAGINWAPIPDLRFRGNYSRSVRAPNLSELYSSQSQNFAPGFADPCSDRNIATGSTTRAANCNAAGRPAGYDFVYVQSLEILSGGNPGLREETSTSYTIGGIFEPRFLPGFSVSVDYYDINVENVISSVSAQTIVNQCYDQASLNNPFCGLFQRAGANGGPRGEVPFQILEGSLLQSTLNFARLKARGIDTNVNFRRTFNWGTVNLMGIYTRTLQRDDFTNPADPNRINRLLGELNDPKNEFRINSSVKVGKITLGYELRWIDKMYLNTFEDFNSLQGRPPENADYAAVQFYPSVTYHNARVDLDVNDRFNLYLGIDNIGNKQPPFGLTGVGGGSGIYDVRGRYGYLGFVAKF
ncbi:TonB-dependent receptor [Sphingomonas pokkalii]|uniref:TonB-dependent receptor n=2 Tax=Sphingomonas pokkalii TaxID=2175090 RepID=A0A2U0SA90_9SPHN|nr:TonB-dependent receptor [Sphingomonas pokkalii]PVX28191.1 TonB-dependent receptor [Sphingomonas pokkalii]